MAPPGARVAVEPLQLTVGERAVRGSWYGSTRPFRDVPLLIDLYRSGRLQLEPLVTRCSLDQVNDALAAMDTASPARSVALTTALIRVTRSLPSSSSRMPSMVHPAGVVTASVRKRASGRAHPRSP